MPQEKTPSTVSLEELSELVGYAEDLAAKIEQLNSEAMKLQLFFAGIISGVAFSLSYLISTKNYLQLPISSPLALIFYALAFSTTSFFIVFALIRLKTLRRSARAERHILLSVTDFISEVLSTAKPTLGVWESFILDMRLSRLSLSAKAIY